MYFILRDPYFGPSGSVGDIMRTVSDTAPGTAILTWGTIILECVIGVLLLSSWHWKKYALALIVTLHLGIAICLGLWSFALVMMGTGTVAAYRLRSRPHATLSANAQPRSTPAPVT
ncbi:hypothetical protein LK09_16935 [Microbacterium mangrovi]|uniref:HTTM domain-containing protein n=2 Tax=Microbacterium mangrovi TaxID=1348253 RepID=A0A0B1ZXT2_9MICO|nr:hypothetical protein LK09_16935 [Microbacterium mangrovi]